MPYPDGSRLAMVPSDLDAPLEALAPLERHGVARIRIISVQHLSLPRRRRATPTRPRGAQRTPAADRAPLVWRSPERHLWVATGDGEYAGMTVFDDRAGYSAVGPTAEPLGRFRSLDEAKAALEASV